MCIRDRIIPDEIRQKTAAFLSSDLSQSIKRVFKIKILPIGIENNINQYENGIFLFKLLCCNAFNTLNMVSNTRCV